MFAYLRGKEDQSVYSISEIEDQKTSLLFIGIGVFVIRWVSGYYLRFDIGR